MKRLPTISWIVELDKSDNLEDSAPGKEYFHSWVLKNNDLWTRFTGLENMARDSKRRLQGKEPAHAGKVWQLQVMEFMRQIFQTHMHSNYREPKTDEALKCITSYGTPGCC